MQPNTPSTATATAQHGQCFIAIDLKSFYASVECVERGLDPLCTNLVVADRSRTSKTICLAVTPSLKAYGISGRARLFEVEERVRQINDERRCFTRHGDFTGRSHHDPDLQANPELELDYIVAPPRMAYYMQYSAKVYGVYLRHFAPEDIHVYSVDEVFIDATSYLPLYKLSPRQLAARVVSDVLQTTGITATAGIGTNLYLCKVAMDIVAKHIAPDANGVRIAELDEIAYRQQLWNHQPLTDFWRIGRGTARKLQANGMHTMGDVARRSLADEALFYRLFGVVAEFVIDHAWGYEPLTMADVKAYRPQSRSISTGQVLQEPYTNSKAHTVVCEMAYSLALDLVAKHLLTPQLTLTIGYDTENLKRPDIAAKYTGPVVADHYGRAVPKHAHGTANMPQPTASSAQIAQAISALFGRITDKNLLVRRINIAAAVVPEGQIAHSQQLSLFDNPAETQQQADKLARERKLQEVAIALNQRFGKNSILRGINFDEGATARQRNKQIGGHKA